MQLFGGALDEGGALAVGLQVERASVELFLPRYQQVHFHEFGAEILLRAADAVAAVVVEWAASHQVATGGSDLDAEAFHHALEGDLPFEPLDLVVRYARQKKASVEKLPSGGSHVVGNPA